PAAPAHLQGFPGPRSRSPGLLSPLVVPSPVSCQSFRRGFLQVTTGRYRSLRNTLNRKEFFEHHGRDATLWRKRCEGGMEELQRCSGRDATGRGKAMRLRPFESVTYPQNGRDATPP